VNIGTTGLLPLDRRQIRSVPQSLKQTGADYLLAKNRAAAAADVDFRQCGRLCIAK
jgi:hypothetical protein